VTLRRLQAPEGDVVSLEQAKQRLRLDYADDEADVELMLASATAVVDGADGRLNRALLTQKWALDLEHFPHPRHTHGHVRSGEIAGREAIPLPLSPLVSIDQITYFDAGGVSQTLDPSAYDVFDGEGGFVEPVFGTCWPWTPRRRRAVTINFTAGYGDDASSVPAFVVQLILLLVGHYYEHREAVVGVDNRDSSAPLPEGIEGLITQLRFRTV